MGEVERPGARVGRKWAGEGVAYPTGQKLARTLPTIREEGHEEPRPIPSVKMQHHDWPDRLWESDLLIEPQLDIK